MRMRISFSRKPGGALWNPRCATPRYTETSMLRTVQATRYVLPLREGGSLPAIVEADDLGLYVVKFRGAGQGILALIAELVAKSAVPLACAFPKSSSSKSIPPWGVTNPTTRFASFS